MKQIDIFQGLQEPKSNIQEILMTLINTGSVSILEFPYLSGFRTRISELQKKHNLHLAKKSILKKNKFGNVYLYTKHILNENNTSKAIELYKDLTNSK